MHADQACALGHIQRVGKMRQFSPQCSGGFPKSLFFNRLS